MLKMSNMNVQQQRCFLEGKHKQDGTLRNPTPSSVLVVVNYFAVHHMTSIKN